MKKTALILMILTVIAKILGFLKEIVLSYSYGASNVTDAYLISMTIPITIFSFIGIGLSTSYIPMHSSIIKEKGIKAADDFTNVLINYLIIICSIVVLGVWVYTTPIVKLFASGFEGETLEMTVAFTKINVIGVYFSGLIYVFTGYLQVRKNYIVPALMIIPHSLLTILAILLSERTLILLPIGSVIAILGQLLFMVPFARNKGFRYKLNFKDTNKNMKNILQLALPIILGVSINQINVLVDRTLASQIAVGGISALNYANRITLFVQGLFVISISTVLYPTISRMASENNIIGLKKSVSEAINAINLLVIPATVGAMILSKPIVEVLFGRGAFDPAAILMTSDALFYYSFGMVAFGLRQILSNAFYSLKDTKTPAINAAISMGMNILLNIILSKYMGISGLALATSISATFCTILLFISYRKKIGRFGLKKILTTFIKILFSSFIMGVTVMAVYNKFLNQNSNNFVLFIAILSGGIIYIIAIYFMKIEDTDKIISIIKKKIGSSLIK